MTDKYDEAYELMSEGKKTDVYDAIAEIARTKQAAKIQGELVDMQTANLVLNVIKAMEESNKDMLKKYLASGIRKMVHFAWKVAKR